MFNLTAKNAIMSTLAAAVLASSISVTPSFAGGGRDPGKKVSTISATNPDGTTTSVRSRNKADTYTITTTKKGKVVNKKRVNKKRKPFITIFNPDGTSRTVTKPSKPGKDFVTLHNSDGTSRTVTKPSKPGKAFITMHNPDGTSTTVSAGDR